jgi:hypothetical protein
MSITQQSFDETPQYYAFIVMGYTRRMQHFSNSRLRHNTLALIQKAFKNYGVPYAHQFIAWIGTSIDLTTIIKLYDPCTTQTRDIGGQYLSSSCKPIIKSDGTPLDYWSIMDNNVSAYSSQVFIINNLNTPGDFVDAVQYGGLKRLADMYRDTYNVQFKIKPKDSFLLYFMWDAELNVVDDKPYIYYPIISQGYTPIEATYDNIFGKLRNLISSEYFDIANIPQIATMNYKIFIDSPVKYISDDQYILTKYEYNGNNSQPRKITHTFDLTEKKLINDNDDNNKGINYSNIPNTSIYNNIYDTITSLIPNMNIYNDIYDAISSINIVQTDITTYPNNSPLTVYVKKTSNNRAQLTRYFCIHPSETYSNLCIDYRILRDTNIPEYSYTLSDVASGIHNQQWPLKHNIPDISASRLMYNDASYSLDNYTWLSLSRTDINSDNDLRVINTRITYFAWNIFRLFHPYRTKLLTKKIKAYAVNGFGNKQELYTTYNMRPLLLDDCIHWFCKPANPDISDTSVFDMQIDRTYKIPELLQTIQYTDNNGNFVVIPIPTEEKYTIEPKTGILMTDDRIYPVGTSISISGDILYRRIISPEFLYPDIIYQNNLTLMNIHYDLANKISTVINNNNPNFPANTNINISNNFTFKYNVSRIQSIQILDNMKFMFNNSLFNGIYLDIGLLNSYNIYGDICTIGDISACIFYIQSTNVSLQIAFIPITGNKNYIDIRYISSNTANTNLNPTSGLYLGNRNLYYTFHLQPNTSVVYESNATGNYWKLYPNSHINWLHPPLQV